MKKMKKILWTLLVLLILAGGGYFAWTQGWLSAFPFLNKPLTIDKTENVVTSVQQISEFVSMNYFEDMTLYKKKASAAVDNKVGKTVSGWFGKSAEDIAADELVVIARGKVRAGYNLSKIGKDDISISGDTLCVKLPEPEIIDAIVNPSDIEVFIEDGSWTHEEIMALESEGAKTLRDHAIAAGIMEKAKENGEEQLKSLFKTFGFKEVKLN